MFTVMIAGRDLSFEMAKIPILLQQQTLTQLDLQQALLTSWEIA